MAASMRRKRSAPSCADIGLAQQNICDDANDRQGQNHNNNPGNPRGGIAMLAQQNPNG